MPGGEGVPAPRHDDGNSTAGPGWNDVRQYLAYLAGQCNRRVRLVVEPETDLSSSSEYRVELWMDGIPVLLGEARFGANDGYGSRTMAGAAYRACIKGEESLARVADIAITGTSPRNRRTTKKS